MQIPWFVQLINNRKKLSVPLLAQKTEMNLFSPLTKNNDWKHRVISMTPFDFSKKFQGSLFAYTYKSCSASLKFSEDDSLVSESLFIHCVNG